MRQISKVATYWKLAYAAINNDIFDFNYIKPLPSEWVENTIVLPEGTTVYPGAFSYEWTPYMREIIDIFHPSNPTRYIAVMKGSQCGLTAGVIVPIICYIIAINPDPILFTAGDIALAAKTVEERLDPILFESGLQHYIRPNVIKKGNNRTGDTSTAKEFAGGTLTMRGTNSATGFRMFSAKTALADDFDTAPQEVGKEGDVTKLIESRQKSYGKLAKTLYGSTPTATATSKIYREYKRGTQKKWHWSCKHCGVFIPVEFRVVGDDGKFAGLIYELDDKKKLIESSVHFRCKHCGGRHDYNDKHDLNLKGDFIATNPNPEKNYESYSLNDIHIPVGFDDWVKIVEEWLQACPPGGRVDVNLLKAFNNQRLGLPFEEFGETPKVNELMTNTRKYKPGIVPDATAIEDGNGKIIMLTLACDLNGFMSEKDGEDVRLDWEIVAHAQTGATYSVDHGSIGTHKRSREKSKAEKAGDFERVKWTMTHRANNNVWDPFEEIIRTAVPLESGGDMPIHITVIDTGFGEKLCTAFINKFVGSGHYVFGVKGKGEGTFRKLARDSNPVKRSVENPRALYILEVDQLKDDISNNMKLRTGEDGSQPAGYMNFPEPNDGKYTMKSFFVHYEGERRIEEKNSSGEVIGYSWKKKHSDVANHFWDVRIYNNAAPLIYLDLWRQSSHNLRQMSWEEFVIAIVG